MRVGVCGSYSSSADSSLGPLTYKLENTAVGARRVPRARELRSSLHSEVSVESALTFRNRAYRRTYDSVRCDRKADSYVELLLELTKSTDRLNSTATNRGWNVGSRITLWLDDIRNSRSETSRMDRSCRISETGPESHLCAHTVHLISCDDFQAKPNERSRHNGSFPLRGLEYHVCQ